MGNFHLTESGKKYLAAVVTCILVYFFMKFISPIVSPFIFAFLVAGILNPLAQFFHRKMKIRKPVIAGTILFVACVLAAVVFWLLVSALVTGGSKMAVQMPDYQEELSHFLEDCCNMMEQRFGVDGVRVEKFIMEQVNVFVENLEVKVLPAVMGKSVGYMKSIVNFVSFVVVMVIGVLLIMKDYDALIQKIREEEELKGVREVGKKVLLYVKTFVKAQIIILCIISAVCAVVLTVLGMKGGAFYGLLTGFMDMLPFIGTGIMLIPLAILRFIDGNYWQALLVFCLYVACALIREFLEPKLIGERVGVWPVGILFAVFAGIQLFGVWGIIKGPLALVIICETCKYLWREKEQVQP